MRSHLILDKGFNDSTVDGFIAGYKQSMNFSKIAHIDGSDDEEDDKIPAEIGDLVQWESGGILQFPTARRVIKFSEDGEFAHVEGSNTGLPIDELEVIERAADQRRPHMPPSFDAGFNGSDTDNEKGELCSRHWKCPNRMTFKNVRGELRGFQRLVENS